MLPAAAAWRKSERRRAEPAAIRALRGRRRDRGSVLLAVTALVGLAVGCAQVGPVLPPSAGLPQPVSNLNAVRSGPSVQLQWTAPSRTSDGLGWDHRGPIAYRLCSWPGIVKGEMPAPLPRPTSPPPQIPGPEPSGAGGQTTPAGRVMPACPLVQDLGSVTAPLRVPVASLRPPAGKSAGAPAGFATVALYALNPEGAGAGWSNPVLVPLTPVAPSPRLLSATPTNAGVQLRWQSASTPASEAAAPAVAVYRDGTLLARVDAQQTGYLDRTAAWNQTYHYSLRAQAGLNLARVESGSSNTLTVTPRDLFPPPVPSGLEVVVGTAGVDLSWNAVEARDLAGYNVYRRLPGGEWERRNAAPLPTPVDHDAAPVAAASAQYAVTAVDQVHNESARSEPVQAYF